MRIFYIIVLVFLQITSIIAMALGDMEYAIFLVLMAIFSLLVKESKLFKP